MHLIGHDDTLKKLLMLKDADVSGRGILLSGSPHIGKRTLALYVAATFLCESASPFPCETCAPCVQVIKMQSPELHCVSKGDRATISIQSIREAKSWASLTPFAGRKKFLLIDDADTLHRTAANALLKLLEEPSRDLFIILITAKPARLLPTLISRCISFRIPSPTWNESILTMIREKRPEYEASLIKRWFHSLDGAVGSLLTAPLVEWEALRLMLCRELVLESKPTPFPDWIETLSTFKREIDFIFDLIASLIRDLAVLLAGANSDLIHDDWFSPAREGLLDRWTARRLDQASITLLEARARYRDVLHFDLFWDDFYYQWHQSA